MKNRFSSAAYSVALNKCPKCHKGEEFEISNPYNFSRGLKMNAGCSCCGQSFEPEPGFYFGAMYTSYAFSVGASFAIYLLLTLLNVETFYAVLWACIGISVLTPVFFRAGRLLWLNLFVSYRPQVCE